MRRRTPNAPATVYGIVAIVVLQAISPVEEQVIRTTTLAAISFLATSPAFAAPPAPTGEAGSAGIPVRAGDTVGFDLSALPEKFEGEAQAICLGRRVDATGPVAATCERTFKFEISPKEARMTFVFKPASGSDVRRIELPISREKKPVTFVAPSAGTLVQPEPTVLPPETAEKAARAAALQQCAECRGVGFRLDSVKVTRPPLPPGGDLPVRIGITPASGTPAPAK